MTGNIYQGKVVIIALAEVQHCERAFTTAHGGRNEKNGAQPNGLQVITSKTHYDFDRDMWSNPAYVPQDEADQFLKEWSAYRERVETPMVIIDPSLRTDVPSPEKKEVIRRMVQGSFAPKHGQDNGWDLWVTLEKGADYSKEARVGYSMEVERMGLSGNLLGCVIEFEVHPHHCMSKTLEPRDYKIVRTSDVLRAAVLEACFEIGMTVSSMPIDLGDQITQKDADAMLGILGKRYRIAPPVVESPDSIGQVLCKFALELDARGNPEMAEWGGEERQWQILNSMGSVTDEFTCPGDPLFHYASKTQLSVSKVREMNYTARPVRPS